MGVDDLRETWDRLGRLDPLWAVLSYPEMRGNRWDRDQFFATGRERMARRLGLAAGLGLPERRDRCLDFGCGVGRLTQALAPHYRRCDGVDVAASMIELARSFNRFGDRCVYHANPRDDLRLFEDGCFDLVHSYLVLQHIPPDLGLRYVAEFLRVLRPGGLALFHAPSGRSADFRLPVPMPEGAYRAGLRVRGLPRLARAGCSLRFQAFVRNEGAGAWPVRRERRWLHVGNHWGDVRGRITVQDDERAELPARDLAPGDEVSVAMAVRVPGRPGLHVLELDVVHEGVTWFAGRGSPPLRRRLLVLPERRAAGGLEIDRHIGSQPWDMHVLPKEDVLAVVERAGGRVVRLVEEDIGDFHDVDYLVTR